MDDGHSSDYDFSYRHVRFKMIGTSFRLSLRHQLRLKLNFYFKLETSNWILNQDCTTPEFTGEGPSSARNTSAFGESPSYDSIRMAVGEATGNLLTDEERGELVELVWIEASGNFPATGALAQFKILNLDFMVLIVKRRVVVVGRDDLGMVPAADSSFGLLEVKCEVDCRSRCCICLKEFGGGGGGGDGGGGLRMPCSHVFHGDCIEKWLRTSHYCPLCRYEMPTETVDEFQDVCMF